jgi:LysR family transcriptional regulator, hypochlorite-specific transcription factor HypT
VSQPAFSRRIRALEDRIGTALFVRRTQGAALTPSGEHFQPLAEGLLRTLDRARRETQSVGERRSSSLAFAATHALSFTFFPGWIRRHARLDAVGTVNLISDSMAACEQTMLSGEVHFLLCHHHGAEPAHLDPERFASVKLGSNRLVAVCVPDASGAPAWPIPGAGATITCVLGYSEASRLGRIIAAHQAGIPATAGADTGFTSHLATTLMTMARDGQGAAWLPLTLAAEDLQSGRLVRAGPDSLDIGIEIRMFRSPDCRNHASDRLWESLTMTASLPLDGAGGF